MLRELRMDLHVHTCLSPCADNSMTPPEIARRAAAAGLQAVAICDHNTGGNVAAVQKAAERHGVAVIPGMEVTTEEEVHVLALFADLRALAAFEGELAPGITGSNDPRYFGDQILADAEGEPTGLEERFLLGAGDLTIGELVQRIHELGGLAVASHVDKSAYSVLSQLGFVPPELDLDALEVSPHASSAEEYRRYRLPILRSSDAHFPADIGSSHSCVLAKVASLEELRLALAGANGRAVLECP